MWTLCERMMAGCLFLKFHEFAAREARVSEVLAPRFPTTQLVVLKCQLPAVFLQR
jgi:hypothetical protein